METEAEFSRKGLRSFLNELADQIESGRLMVQIPGHTKGKISMAPKQPITVEFERDEDDETLEIEIKFKEDRPFVD